MGRTYTLNALINIMRLHVTKQRSITARKCARETMVDMFRRW